MSLSTEPVRPLKSREIARVLAGLLGSMADWCEPEELAAAIEHIHSHEKEYTLAWRTIRDQAIKRPF